MRNTGFKVSQFYNMQYRASHQAASDSIRVKVHPDVDRVSLNDRHVAIKDVMMTTVAHVDAEWLEWIRRD